MGGWRRAHRIETRHVHPDTMYRRSHHLLYTDRNYRAIYMFYRAHHQLIHLVNCYHIACEIYPRLRVGVPDGHSFHNFRYLFRAMSVIKESVGGALWTLRPEWRQIKCFVTEHLLALFGTGVSSSVLAHVSKFCTSYFYLKIYFDRLSV